VSTLLHSPKFRAQQTANILESGIHVTGTVETCIELDPMASLSYILNYIKTHNEDILLVGHMPYMGRLAAKLLTGNESNDMIIFKTGTLVCLEEIERQRWAMVWMLGPDLWV
jgi:phosphohistidine phosphatase